MKLPLVLVLLFFATGASAQISYTTYLKIDGLSGEDSSPVFGSGLVKLKSFSISAEKPSEGLTGQSRRRGDVEFSAFAAAKLLDRTSPELFIRLAGGQILPKVEVLFEKTGSAGTFEYYRITLENVGIAGVTQSSEDGGLPRDELRFSYEIIRWKYIEVDPDTGNVTTTVETAWDVEKGFEP